jgi:uncharacterized protein YjbJ (UPF0337 family)
MDWEHSGDNWRESKERARKRWVKLTDEDLEHVSGQRDKLVIKIQKLYGIPREEAEAQVKEWEGLRF